MSYRLFLPAVILPFLCSCNAEPHTPPSSSESLIINKIGTAETKAPYMNPILEGEFGTMLIDDSGKDTYDGKSYVNVGFKINPDGTCTSSQEILLSTTEAVLYSYYPYSEDITDFRNISLDLSADASIDYMTGTPVKGLKNRNNSADITMNHALASINIALVRGRYSGPGIITKVSVCGEGIARKAVLDATTGTLHDLSEVSAEIHIPIESEVLSSTALDNYLMVIPTGQIRPVTIKITIDGMEFSITTEPTELQVGTITSYTVIVNSEVLEIAKGDVNQWNDRPVEYFELEVV